MPRIRVERLRPRFAFRRNPVEFVVVPKERIATDVPTATKGWCMVHGRPVISHSLLPDRFFVFCVARLPFLRSQLPGRLTPRWGLGCR